MTAQICIQISVKFRYFQVYSPPPPPSKACLWPALQVTTNFSKAVVVAGKYQLVFFGDVYKSPIKALVAD